MQGKTGIVLFEVALPANEPRPLDTPGVHVAGADENDLFVVTQGRDVRRIRTGHISWHWAPAGPEEVRITATVPTADAVYVVGAYRKGEAWHPRIYVLTLRGELVSSEDIAVPLAHGPSGLLLLPWTRRKHIPVGLQVQAQGGPHVAFVGQDRAVHAVRLDAPARAVHAVRARHGGAFAHVQNVGLGDRGFFVGVRDDAKAEILQVSETGRLYSAWEMEEEAPDAVYDGFIDRTGHAYILRVYFTTSQHLLNQHVYWADARTGMDRGQVTGMSFQYDHDMNGAVLATPFEVSKVSEYQLKVRMALVTASGAVHLVQDGEHQWVLEEGLAATTHALLVQMPDRALGRGAVALQTDPDGRTAPLIALERESLAGRLVRHAGMLLRAPRHMSQWIVRERGGFDWMMRTLMDTETPVVPVVQPTAGGPREAGTNTTIIAPRVVPSSEFSRIVHDHFGLEQVMVAVTSYGKVYGIRMRMDRSVLLWQRSLLGYGAGEGAPASYVRPIKLVQTRATGTVVDRAVVPPLVAVVAEVRIGDDSLETRVFEMNPLTGETARESDDGVLLCKGHAEVVQLPSSSTDTRTLGVVCGDGVLVVYPPDHVLQHAESLHVPLLDASRRTLHGHVVRHYDKAAWALASTWRWSLGPGEEFVSVVDPSTDPVASLGRVLGDRSVLYKYLNPHMRLITTQTPKESVANVYLLDTVSGSVLYHMHLPEVALVDGVRTTLAENWITVQYATNQTAEGSLPQPRPENAAPWYVEATQGFTRRIVSVELYHAEEPTATDASSLTTGTAGAVTSYEEPVAYLASFLLPYGVRATGVTRTTLGVTTKGLVVATDRENVVVIPRAFLDPRRPLGKPSASDMEEGLVPYRPEIPDDPHWHISRAAYRLTALHTLVTGPALLESSAMVLGLGLDWLYALATPSGQFDRLPDAFNKLQLVLVIAGLVAGIALTAPIVRSRRLAARW